MSIIDYINQASLCKQFYESAKYEDGITLALEAINTFPNKKGDINFLLGLNYFGYSGIFYKQGRSSRALKELKNAENAFRKVLKSSNKGKEVEAFYYLGLICERQEKCKKAAKYYKKALSKEPDFKAAIERLNRCLENRQ